MTVTGIAMHTLALCSALMAATADTGAVATYMDRYREINGLTPLVNQVAPLSGFILRRDAAEITFSQGTAYLLSPVGGRTVGAVIRGAGRVRLTPPHAAEREALERLVGAPQLDDSVTEVIILFSDSTPEQLRRLTFAAGEVPGDIAPDVHDFIASLRGQKDNTLDPAVLGPLLNDEPDGFFLAHLQRAHGDPLVFLYDPAVVEAVQILHPVSQLHYRANWWVASEFAPAAPLPGSSGMWHYRQRLATPRYAMEVWLKPTAGADLDYAASARIALSAKEAVGPWLHFLLDEKLNVDSARWSDGAAVATFKAKDDADLWVRAPRRLAGGDSASLTLFYHGNLIDRYDDWFFIDPDAAWYPRNSQGGDAATFDMIYHSPSWYPLASVGVRTDSTVDGKVMTTHWVTSRPTPFATFNLGLFNVYHAADSGAPPLDIMMSEDAHRALSRGLISGGYMIASQKNMSQVVAADVSNSLKWFTHAFGPPLYDHFYVTEIPYSEGVSFPGMIDLSWATFQNTALDGFDEFFRAHEVAHQWWGNGVRPATYRDAWLSEGVASFCGLWYLQSVRHGNKEYFRFLDTYAQNIKDNRDAGVTWLGYRDASNQRRYGYQAMIYEKGAWITHMLRMLMLDLSTGKDDRFSAMMRDFHERFAGQSATTADFQRVAEEHVGVPMDWFFDQWVKGDALPTYNVAWTSEATPDGKQRVRLRVTQEGVPPDFQAWVLVSADLGNNRFANFRIKVSGAQTEYLSPLLPIAPRAVTFNELHSVLADVKNERW
ncbi:MAG TPA: M1 family aminopeptidase [Thermoanaerobaculia bacterium]